MPGPDLGRRAAGVGSLADPLRRRVYDHVTQQPEPVGRDDVAQALDVPRHTARFHLDRLVEAGLLVTESRRRTGRTGPGAGRPAKLYRRAPGELTVSLPERRYDLAGGLLADAVDRSASTGEPVLDTLDTAARERGRELGAALGAAPSATDAVCTALSDLGYEPAEEDGAVVLRNCPFHALVADHTSLVCGMNLALLDGVVGAAGASLTPRLEPAPGRCCVVLAPEPPA